MCRHDKNYYYFCKSNISVINLIAGSRNTIKVSKNMSFEKIDQQQESCLRNTDNFLAFFIVFE